MTIRRTLAMAAAAAVMTGLAAPTIAAEGFETQILRSDTWKPGYTKTDDGDYKMIVPETQEEADGMPMQMIRSETWEPGYLKTDQGDYVLLAPAQEAKDQTVRLERSETWEPGYMKTDDGDYVRLVETD